MNRWTRHWAHTLVSLGFVLAACSGTTNDGNPSSAGASNAGAGGASSTGGAGVGGSSAGGGSNGPIACGANTCSVTQFCVIPCCGGTAPACVAMTDAGTCPVGTHAGCTFSSGSQCSNPAACCQYDPCTPPPRYCSDTQPVGCFTPGRTCQMMCA